MNRRNFLQIGVPGKTVRSGTEYRNEKAGQLQPVFMRRSDTDLSPYTGTWDYPQAAHLLRRCMVGATDAEIRQSVDDGLQATVAKLLQPFEPSLDMLDWAGDEPQIRALAGQSAQEFQQQLFERRQQLHKWWLKIIAESSVSIQERMTLFWHNHFTSEFQVVQLAEYMLGQNQLLRRSMLGNFRQFVRDISVDMAMLIYLDGIKSFKTGNRVNINENYARELMELYTMGVTDWEGTPNYTQDDVVEVARALSGWFFTASDKGNYYAGLKSQFVELRWDAGQKTVFGRTGAWDLDDIIDLIFTERADQTAKFICEKIYRAFVYDYPDRVVVEQMAETFRNGNWEIRPVIEQLLSSTHFYDVTNMGAMEKSPTDYLLGMIRGLSLTNIPDFEDTSGARTARDLMGRLETLGQLVFNPPNVKGWPGGRTWISTSTLPVREKFALDVFDGKIERNRETFYEFDAIAFGKSLFPWDSEADNRLLEFSNIMARFLLNTPPSEMEAQTLYDTILDGGVYYEWDFDNPDQRADERMRKFLKAVAQLAKYQLY